MKLRSALVLLPMLACGDSALPGVPGVPTLPGVHGIDARLPEAAAASDSGAARANGVAVASRRGLTGYVRATAGPVRAADVLLAVEILREAGALKIAIQASLLTEAARADCQAAGLMPSRARQIQGESFNEFYVNLYKPPLV